MSDRIEVTDEMAKRVYGMYYAKMPTTDYISGVAAMKDALEAALNQPPVVCKNCGKPKDEHAKLTAARRCLVSVWEPAS